MTMERENDALTGRLQVTVDPALAAATEARIQFVRWLSGQDADPETIEELAVVVSELMSNAVRASRPRSSPSMTAWLDGADLVLEVGNSLTPESAAVLDWDDSDALRGAGRGLLLVQSFVDEFHVIPDHDGHSIVIRCRRRLRS